MSSNYKNLSTNKNLAENLSNNHIKTTDVNILLNRVRLDKEKTFKKNIIFSILLVGLICSIAFYLII